MACAQHLGLGFQHGPILLLVTVTSISTQTSSNPTEVPMSKDLDNPIDGGGGGEGRGGTGGGPAPRPAPQPPPPPAPPPYPPWLPPSPFPTDPPPFDPDPPSTIGPYDPSRDVEPPEPPEPPEFLDDQPEPPDELNGGRDIEPPYPSGPPEIIQNEGQGDDPGGGGCFVAGTLIHTDNGEPVRIENIRVGTKVWSLNVADNAVVLGTVEEVFHAVSDELITLAFGGEVLHCTPRHRFFTGTWIAAGELTPGQAVRGLDGGAHEIRLISRRPAQEPVFNFRVDPAHTYFVGRTGLVVHNDKNADTGETGDTDSNTWPA